MWVGLIDIESKIFNTAYMQIAAFHKRCGDTVGWWSPLTDRRFDVVYCSSLFDFTDKSEVPARAVCGGTGFDVKSKLNKAIGAAPLDYSIYPKCKTSYIWFSRGCNRRCPWCVVPEKEGPIQPVDPKNLNPNGKYITVCDNNFFANPFWKMAISHLKNHWGQPVDFQGVDVRTLNKEKCIALLSLRHYKQIKIAWDNPREDLYEKLLWVTRLISARWLMCYVLVGFNSTEQEDLYRIETLRGLNIDPFVMPYNRSDLYQKAFARWVNHKAIFKTVEWADYYGRVREQESAGTGWQKK